MTISADGGTPELLFQAEGENVGRPQILPDGKSVLYTNIVNHPNKGIFSRIMMTSAGGLNGYISE